MGGDLRYGDVLPRACAQLLLRAVPSMMRGVAESLRHQPCSDDEAATMVQFRLLELLHEKPRTLSELAAFHHVTPSSMSRTVDVLVRRAWVARDADPADRRQVVLKLTDAGGAVRTVQMEQIHECIARFLGQLDPDDLRRLHAGISALDAVIEKTVGHVGWATMRGAPPPTHGTFEGKEDEVGRDGANTTVRSHP